MARIPNTNQSTVTFNDSSLEEYKQAINHLRQHRYHLWSKRCFDIGVSLGLLVVLLPLMVLVAILIRLETSGPVIFAQERIGKNQTRFRFYKFRSMISESGGIVPPYSNSAETGYLLKIQYDPRVTRVGAVIRKLSIDELPQLVNVLNGTMSLVGPRPLVPHMLNPYPRFSSLRHVVKPGITGLWQVYDRAHNDNAGYMMSYDTQYVCQFNLLLDLKILLLTVPSLLSMRGAF